MTVVAGILVLAAVAGWASGRLPEHVVAITFFTLAILLRVAPPSVVLSGFTSGAIWLIFGGQVMGVAIRHTGLARRLADTTASRLAPRSYPALVAGVVAVGTGLAFLLPSAMGRVALYVPIAAALADRYGFVEPGNGRTGVLLAAAFGTTVPAFAILPGSVPNAVLAGIAETEHHVVLGYLEYLALHFPLLGAAKAALCALVVVALFPAKLGAVAGGADSPPPLTREEGIVSVIVGLALVAWATDSVHGVSPAWVSLGAGLVILLLGSRVLPPRAFDERINFASLFFVAGILGVGAVLAHTGLALALGRAVRAGLPLVPGAAALNYGSLAAIGTTLSLLTTSPGLPAVMTPLVESLATATGFPIRTVLMAEVLGFSNNLLPYQSPPLVVGSQLAAVAARETTKVSVVLFAASTLVVLPVNYLWWRLLGWL